MILPIALVTCFINPSYSKNFECSELQDSDDELVKAQNRRECRILQMKVSLLPDNVSKKRELERISKNLKHSKMKLNYQTDISVTDNYDLIASKNQKKIEENKQLNEEVNKDIDKSKKGLKLFIEKQSDSNQMFEDFINTHQSDAEKIKNDLRERRAKIEENRELIDRNIALSNEKHEKSLIDIHQEAQKRDKMFNKLQKIVNKNFSFIERQITEKLGSTCSAMTHCESSYSAALSANQIIEIVLTAGEVNLGKDLTINNTKQNRKSNLFNQSVEKGNQSMTQSQ